MSKRIRQNKKGFRPTTGLVLGALFNILGDIKGLYFLDLFAGSFRVSFEAYKRGAIVYSVEKDYKLVKEFTKDNMDLKVFVMDVKKAIKLFSSKKLLFDVIFADPPYDSDWPNRLPYLIESAGILKDRGVLVIEHSSRNPLTLKNSLKLNIVDVRKYGETSLSFLKYQRG